MTEADHRFITDLPTLTDPVLVVMLSGWIDASGAAAEAMSAIQQEIDAVPLVAFDDDLYIDYRARRPTLEIRDGESARLVWSSPEMQFGTTSRGRDLVVLHGPEPDTAWHRFGRTVGELSERLGVRRMVALGAYPFATPHTRPVVVTATSPSRDLIAGLPYRTNSVDVPAGMAAVLEQELHGRGIPSVSVWAQVPHYVASMSYPAASVALLDGLTTVAGVAIEAAELRNEAVVQRERLDQLVAGNDEHRAMVAQFEEIFDAADETDDASSDGSGTSEGQPADGELELTSGDELAGEIERFLRDRDQK
ncbi:MAG: proteasome assembly chaperone family protein [Desertimonas sp.]